MVLPEGEGTGFWANAPPWRYQMNKITDAPSSAPMAPLKRRKARSDLSLPFNPSRCSEDRLRPFVRSTGPWLRRTPGVDPRVPCGVSDARRRKTEANRTDRPTADFRVAGTPRRPEGSYAAWRV